MKMLSVKQFAELAGISRQYVWQLIKMNRIKSQKIGNYYIIPELEVLKYKNLYASDKNQPITPKSIINKQYKD